MGGPQSAVRMYDTCLGTVAQVLLPKYCLSKVPDRPSKRERVNKNKKRGELTFGHRSRNVGKPIWAKARLDTRMGKLCLAADD